jgi:hypothetical protein
VSPDLETKGMMLLYNPLKVSIARTINLPLYYTGLTGKVVITNEKGIKMIKQLERDYTTTFTFSIPPESYTWFKISAQ